MTQSAYGEGYDAFGRPNPQRAPASAAYYERANPYTHSSYYDPPPHQDLRSEYGRTVSRTLIQEQGSDHGSAGLQRRRIQVAVRSALGGGVSAHSLTVHLVFTLQETQNQMHWRSW